MECIRPSDINKAMNLTSEKFFKPINSTENYGKSIKKKFIC